jgi:DNA invertase Pin-like site-specific DNA recombinase
LLVYPWFYGLLGEEDACEIKRLTRFLPPSIIFHYAEPTISKTKDWRTAMATGKFVAYYRVSTDRQGKSGLGLEAQREAVTRYLNGGSWTLAGEFVEVESGKGDAERPQLEAALKLCRGHKAALVVAKLDRLSRDVRQFLEIMDSGVEVRFVELPDLDSTTPEGRMMLTQLASFAEFERRRISQRTKAALAAAKARGVRLGGPNLDQDRNTDTTRATARRTQLADAYVADLSEVVEDIKAQGTTSLSGIARELNSRGITTRRGGEWSASTVMRMMDRLKAA